MVSTKNDSEGWEDMDEDEDVDSDDESDEGGSGKPKKLFKTENETRVMENASMQVGG